MRFLANDVLTAVNMNINVFTRTSTSHYFGLSSFLEAVADPGFTNGRGQGRGAEVEDRGAGRCLSPEKKNSILDLKMASLSAFWALFFLHISYLV